LLLNADAQSKQIAALLQGRGGGRKGRYQGKAAGLTRQALAQAKAVLLQSLAGEAAK
jgi:hypothetical protein